LKPVFIYEEDFIIFGNSEVLSAPEQTRQQVALARTPLTSGEYIVTHQDSFKFAEIGFFMLTFTPRIQ